MSPLVRLTNASDPPLEDVGTPAGLLNSLGSYITGERHVSHIAIVMGQDMVDAYPARRRISMAGCRSSVCASKCAVQAQRSRCRCGCDGGHDRVLPIDHFATAASDLLLQAHTWTRRM